MEVGLARVVVDHTARLGFAEEVEHLRRVEVRRLPEIGHVEGTTDHRGGREQLSAVG